LWELRHRKQPAVVGSAILEQLSKIRAQQIDSKYIQAVSVSRHAI